MVATSHRTYSWGFEPPRSVSPSFWNPYHIYLEPLEKALLTCCSVLHESCPWFRCFGDFSTANAYLNTEMCFNIPSLLESRRVATYNSVPFRKRIRGRSVMNPLLSVKMSSAFSCYWLKCHLAGRQAYARTLWILNKSGKLWYIVFNAGGIIAVLYFG